MAKYVRVALGISPVWKLSEEDEGCFYTMARILNFIAPPKANNEPTNEQVAYKELLIGQLSENKDVNETELVLYESVCKLLNLVNPHSFETQPWTRIAILPANERLTIFEAHVPS
ncbi:hypothetical protein QR680_011889 [Steinernema hermaphroditum]|uniref:Uncharacterized protein n=1 Tax=Steinernema hermaphroditum TaxID=289476 RepID=A0AA39LZR2_9BILA|nr:hypothetical protein QR680_011889 [Steinernema hermaphroditum]